MGWTSLRIFRSHCGIDFEAARGTRHERSSVTGDLTESRLMVRWAIAVPQLRPLAPAVSVAGVRDDQPSCLQALSLLNASAREPPALSIVLSVD
jgi:hypothetical protein